MAKAYIVGQINITNMEEYKKYAEKVFDIVTSFGGKYLSKRWKRRYFRGTTIW